MGQLGARFAMFSSLFIRSVSACTLLLAGVLMGAAPAFSAGVQGVWMKGPKADGAMTGASSGKELLPICRANFDNGQHPGKLWKQQCNFEWGWNDKLASDYEVLKADSRYQWVNPYSGTYGRGPGKLPDNFVIGGDAGDASKHVQMGICQAFVKDDGRWHPGKFFDGKCNIAYGGPEATKDSSKKMRVQMPDADGNVKVLVAGSGAPPSPQNKIVISATKKPQQDAIVITGSGFKPNAPVTVRVTDPKLPLVLITDIGGKRITSSGSGTLDVTFTGFCSKASEDALKRKTLYFSANDGRSVPSNVDATGTLWSNTVTVGCT
jgi:hypothetical protein